MMMRGCRFYGAILWTFVAVLGLRGEAAAQTAQVGADARARSTDSLRIDYVGYRPARYETEFLSEPQNERPNVGGLIYVYFANVSEKPLDLAFWRANGKDESYWTLGGSLAWSRNYDRGLAPGESGVLEINAVTEEFGEGKPFSFSYVQRAAMRPAGQIETVLREDPIQIAYLRVLPGMRSIEVHVRNRGQDNVNLVSAEIVGLEATGTTWVGQTLKGGANAIARLELEQPIAPATLIVARVGLSEGKDTRFVFAHRRAFEDWFPIGCWSNGPDTYAELRRLHIETCVRGGRADDEFYSQIAPEYGFRTMVPSEKPVDVDQLRSLGDNPVVACWMLADEPDWSKPANIMLCVDETVRHYNQTKPTFITLCRNVKFFEYAPVCDIPCMDHYSVTAPTSSKWPKIYGTHLEETGYYTRDLKRCSEPKPIWVWSQAVADWGERPKRPVPTPNELAVQLLQNLGYGAKGIIWFNHDKKSTEKFPDVRDAMQGWGRVMCVTRSDLVASEPLETPVKAPDKVIVLPLVTWDKVLLCVTNADYEIHNEAYPFVAKQEVEIAFDLPDWIRPAAALAVMPDGIAPVPFKVKRDQVEVTLGDVEAAKFVVLANDAATEQAYRAAYAQAVAEEQEE